MHKTKNNEKTIKNQNLMNKKVLDIKFKFIVLLSLINSVSLRDL